MSDDRRLRVRQVKVKIFNRRNTGTDRNMQVMLVRRQQVTSVGAVPVVIYVLVSVIHTEGLINGGALVHELYRAASVGRYVTDGQQSAERERRQCSRGQSDRLNCQLCKRD